MPISIVCFLTFRCATVMICSHGWAMNTNIRSHKVASTVLQCDRGYTGTLRTAGKTNKQYHVSPRGGLKVVCGVLSQYVLTECILVTVTPVPVKGIDW